MLVIAMYLNYKEEWSVFGPFWWDGAQHYQIQVDGQLELIGLDQRYFPTFCLAVPEFRSAQ